VAILRRVKLGVWKSAVLEHKGGNTSETRRDRGKVTMGGLQEIRNSQTLFRAVPFPTPTASTSPRLGVHNPTQNSNPNCGEQSIWKAYTIFFGNRKRGHSQGLPQKILGTPYYPRNG